MGHLSKIIVSKPFENQRPSAGAGRGFFRLLGKCSYTRQREKGDRRRRGQLGLSEGGYQLVGSGLPAFENRTSNPFPERLALEFLDGLDEVLVIEELSPVIERALVHWQGGNTCRWRFSAGRPGTSQEPGKTQWSPSKRRRRNFWGSP